MTGDLPRYAAANARVRTLLGSLLGRTGLDALATYPSPELLLDALQRTPYGGALETRRGAEAVVDARLTIVGRALLAALTGAERAFAHLYLLRCEVEHLKILIRAVHNGWAWSQVAPYVSESSNIATIDLESVASARDLRELTERLGGTAYGAAAGAALHRVEEAGPFALEAALELDYYDRLWSALDTLRDADAERGRHLLGILFDVLNLNWIARYRDVLGLSPEEILNYTLRQGRWITPTIRRALAEEAPPAWEAALFATPYAAMVAGMPPHGFDAVSTALWRCLATEAQRRLAGYPFHIGVPLAFLLTQEIEIRDLHMLLAAKSIGAPAAEIADHLASVRP